MTAPDETPRATLREDERAVAEVVYAHQHDGTGYCTCWCGWLAPTRPQHVPYGEQHAAHVAEQIAPLLAAARAEGWGDHHRAHCSTVNPHADPAARIARTAPSTDQATTAPGVTGGSGEDEG